MKERISYSELVVPFGKFEERVLERKEVPDAETAIQWIEEICQESDIKPRQLAIIVEGDEKHLHKLVQNEEPPKHYEKRSKKLEENSTTWNRSSKDRDKLLWDASRGFCNKYAGTISRLEWDQPIADADTVIIAINETAIEYKVDPRYLLRMLNPILPNWNPLTATYRCKYHSLQSHIKETEALRKIFGDKIQ